MQETRFINCFGDPKAVFQLKAAPFLTKSEPDSVLDHNPMVRVYIAPDRFLLLEALNAFQIEHSAAKNSGWLILRNGTKIKLEYSPPVIFDQIAKSGYTLTKQEDTFVLSPKPSPETVPEPPNQLAP